MDLDGYAVYCVTKELYTGKSYVTLSELGDPELFHDNLLRLIIHGILIIRSVKFSVFGLSSRDRTGCFFCSVGIRAAGFTESNREEAQRDTCWILSLLWNNRQHRKVKRI